MSCPCGTSEEPSNRCLRAFEAGRLAAIRAEVQWHVDHPELYPDHVTGQRVELELNDLHRWLEAAR